MRFQYLGTAAAEGWPGGFCTCENCKKAAALGGKNIRTRSQALIEDDLLLDLPPDTYMHKLIHGFDLSAIRYLFVTHWHMDHFYPQELCVRGAYYTSQMTNQELHIYCAEETKDHFYKVAGWELEKESDALMHWHILTPYETVNAGPYRVTPLPARHMRGWPKDHPYIYLIEKGESKLLYAHDTGYLYEEVWDYLTDLAGRIDGRLTAVSLDCTHGNDVIGDNGGHMGLPDAIRVKDRLLQIGLCDENTRFIVNHFSHNSGPLPTELAEIAAGHDIQVSYDGMTLDI